MCIWISGLDFRLVKGPTIITSFFFSFFCIYCTHYECSSMSIDTRIRMYYITKQSAAREQLVSNSSSSSSRLCPSTAGCSPPSMSSIVVCLLLSWSRWFPPSLLSSCHLLLGRPLDLFPLLGCYSAAFGPPIVLHSCYIMTGQFQLLLQCVSGVKLGYIN